MQVRRTLLSSWATLCHVVPDGSAKAHLLTARASLLRRFCRKLAGPATLGATGAGIQSITANTALAAIQACSIARPVEKQKKLKPTTTASREVFIKSSTVTANSRKNYAHAIKTFPGAGLGYRTSAIPCKRADMEPRGADKRDVEPHFDKSRPKSKRKPNGLDHGASRSRHVSLLKLRNPAFGPGAFLCECAQENM